MSLGLLADKLLDKGEWLGESISRIKEILISFNEPAILNFADDLALKKMGLKNRNPNHSISRWAAIGSYLPLHLTPDWDWIYTGWLPYCVNIIDKEQIPDFPPAFNLSLGSLEIHQIYKTRASSPTIYIHMPNHDIKSRVILGMPQHRWRSLDVNGRLRCT
jgi:hypothetical protein